MSDVGNQEISEALATAIERRRRELHLTVSELARKAGVSQQGLMPLRRGEVRNYQERLTGPVCVALRWTPDSIDRLISGGEPVELRGAETSPAETAAEISRLAARVDETQAILRAMMSAMLTDRQRAAIAQEVAEAQSQGRAPLREA